MRHQPSWELALLSRGLQGNIEQNWQLGYMYAKIS